MNEQQEQQQQEGLAVSIARALDPSTLHTLMAVLEQPDSTADLAEQLQIVAADTNKDEEGSINTDDGEDLALVLACSLEAATLQQLLGSLASHDTCKGLVANLQRAIADEELLNNMPGMFDTSLQHLAESAAASKQVQSAAQWELNRRQQVNEMLADAAAIIATGAATCKDKAAFQDRYQTFCEKHPGPETRFEYLQCLKLMECVDDDKPASWPCPAWGSYEQQRAHRVKPLLDVYVPVHRRHLIRYLSMFCQGMQQTIMNLGSKWKPTARRLAHRYPAEVNKHCCEQSLNVYSVDVAQLPQGADVSCLVPGTVFSTLRCDAVQVIKAFGYGEQVEIEMPCKGWLTAVWRWHLYIQGADSTVQLLQDPQDVQLLYCPQSALPTIVAELRKHGAEVTDVQAK